MPLTVTQTPNVAPIGSDAISPASTDAVGLIGIATKYSRQDHKHPAQAVSADANNALIAGVDGLHFLDVAQFGKYKGLYSSTAAYKAMDMVIDANGVLWISNFDRAAGVWPASPSEGIAADTFRRVTGKDRGPFNFNLNYAVGEVAYDDTASIGSTAAWYRNVSPHTAGNAPNPADWAMIGATAPTRVHLTNTQVAPAIAGAPTLTEIQTAVGLIFPTPPTDTILYYTGDDLPASVPTYVYHVDSAGAVTLLEKPAGAVDSAFALVDPVGLGNLVFHADAISGTGTVSAYTGPAATLEVISLNTAIANKTAPVFLRNAGSGTVTLAAEASLTGGLTGDTSLAVGDVALITYNATGLAAYAKKLGSADVTWVETVNGSTLEVGGHYILQAGHTVTLPAGSLGDAVSIIPANGDWPTLGATINPSAGWTVGLGQDPIPATSDVALFVVTTATNYLIVVGGASAVVPANDRVFADDTTVAPAVGGAPTAVEIAAFATAGSHVDTVIYYTGTDTAGDTPTYVYHVDASGNVTEIERPVSLSGLVDVSSSAPATIAWGRHTRITSGTPSAILTLANTTTAATGDTTEIYNATAFDLVVAVAVGNSILGTPTDLTLPPNSGITARIVAPLTVELVGIGKPIEEVAGTNGHVVIGGTMLQWGRFTSTSDADEAFVFPTAFSGVPYMVNANIAHNLTTTVTGRALQSSITAIGFSFNREDTIANTDDPTIHWFAVGPA